MWLRTAALVAVLLVLGQSLERRNYGFSQAEIKEVKERLVKLRQFRDAKLAHMDLPQVEEPKFVPRAVEPIGLVGANGCDPGYMGPNCKNPICKNETSPYLTHDGMAGIGDRVEVEVSLRCQERFTFPVDFTMSQDVHITVTQTVAGRPFSRLYDPLGNEVLACGDEVVSQSETVQKYCELIRTNGEGLYTAVLNSEMEGPCAYEVNAQTFLFPDGGFVLTPQDDVVPEFITGENDAINALPVQGTPYYFAFKMTHDIYPVTPEVLHIYQNGRWSENFDFVARYHCATPHITTTTFNCTQMNYYHMKFQGTDEHGNQWQRVYNFDCDAAIPTGAYTGTYPTPQPQDKCDNEGQLSANGTCYCGPFFEGPQCELRKCLNDGRYDFQNQRCVCQTGYQGDSCEHVFCPNPNWQINDLRQRALGFVVRSSQSMMAQMDQIVAAATNITAAFSAFHPDYLQAYVLSVVQNNAVLFTHEFQNYNDFISAIRSMTHPPTDTDCDDALLLGVTEVLEQPSFQKYQKSPIFIYSDGTANDDVDVRYALLNQLSHFRGQLFFMLSDSVTGRCNIALNDVGYSQMRGLAAFSQGQVIKTPLDQIASASVALAESTWMMNELITNDLEDCRMAPKYNTFFVDETTDYLVISATGDKLAALVTAPNRTVLKPIQWYQTGNLYLWVIDTPDLYVGNWLVSISTLSADKSVCQYRVTARSNYDLFIGITNSLNSDETDTQPTWRQPAHLVAHINNVFHPDLLGLHAEVMVTTNDVGGRREMVYASSGIFRDSCNFYLYFGSFTCQRPNMMYYVSVYTTDSQGHTLLRTSTGFCSASAPTVIPPDGCANGGVMVNGTCICAAHYNGPKCQSVICENQGTPLFGACQCPAGFSGDFCEYSSCNQRNTFTEFFLNRKTLSVLVHDSITTRSVMRTLNDTLPRLVEDIRFTHREWITGYQIVRFNSTTHTAVADTNDPNAFIKGMRTLAQRNYDNSEISCLDLDLFPALYETLTSHDASFGGIVYVFINGLPKLNAPVLSKIFNHLEVTKTSVNIIQTATSPCGKDIYDAASTSLMSLAEFSSGMFTISMANKAGDIFSALPTTYSSQLVTENWLADCTKPTTFYIPVDSLTQSLSVVINGDLVNDPVYTAPDGGRFKVLNMWNDVGYGSRGDQVIQPCEQGWDQYDNRCFKFGLTHASWDDAALACHQQGASLASVFNQGDQDYLSYQAGSSVDYWIGLNDKKTTGKFEWDTPFNFSLTLDTTGYANWASGQPITDPTKTCVYDSQKGITGPKGWNVVDCSQQFSYVCQKHIYNQFFEPRDPNSDFLPRGIWQVQVQTDEGSCSVAAAAQSQLRVYVEYTTDIHDDFGYVEPFQGPVENRIIAHVTGLLPSTKYSLEYAHFYQNNLTIIQAQPMRYRDNCLFDFISAPFQCPYPTFQMMLSGVDNYGYLYQRVLPVSCLGGPTPSDCENGGQYYRGQCICPPHLYGEYCQVADCENGGRVTGSLNSCDCPPGFSGRFCEIAQCTRGGNKPDVDTEHRTFVLLLDGIQTGTYTNLLGKIDIVLSTFFNTTGTSFPTWFSSYVGVIYRNQNLTDHGGAVLPLITNSDPGEFINSIKTTLTNQPAATDDVSRSIFTSMVTALTAPQVKSRSVAYAILNGFPDDFADIDLAMDAISRTHTQVNLLVFGDKGTPGNATYPALEPLFDTIHMSGGAVYFLTDENTFATQWGAISLTLHDSYYLLSTFRQDCSNLDEYLQTGANMSTTVIDMFAEQKPDVSISWPNGTKIRPVYTLQTNTNTIGVFNNLWTPGIMRLGIDDNQTRSGGCLLNVRGVSNLEVMLAFTQDVAEDGGLHSNDAYLFPEAGFESNAVVAAVNDGSTILQYVQLFDVDERRLQWASPLVARAGCTYPYISRDTFHCNRHSFTVAIDGLDFEGHPFRRMFTIHCIGFIPTRAPYTGTPYTGTFPTRDFPTTSPLPVYPTCAKETPKIDLVIAFDSSETMTEDVYLGIIDQFYTLSNLVVFGTANTRVLMGTYDNIAHFERQDFNDTTNISSYLTRIVELMFAGYTGGEGNNIQAVLDYLVRNENAVTPFRPDARKMIVLFSSLGWDKGNSGKGFLDPTADVNDLKGLNLEFYPIGWGSKANMTQLQALSSCARHAQTEYELTDSLNWLWSNICSANVTC
ncbi:unnamed protein product, partial [Mesorhabditis spiculigera]